MRVAQRLYEGVDTGDGRVGLITYMRTDSTVLAGVAMGEARQVISGRYGLQYVMPRGRVYKTKTKGAQEAHEAIRPTSFARDPDSLAGVLDGEELRLYRLIWQRALASQMAPKELETTTVDLTADGYGLRATATKTVFDGFAAVYTEGTDDPAADDEGRQLPALAKGDQTSVRDVTPSQHFTQPPPRFTEAALIKALEEHGIGRPSTYASIISTIIDRGYVKVVERRLRPEPVGEVVTDLLVEHFGEFVDVDFTARMEEELDEVARGEREWVPLLRDFYGPFSQRVTEKRSELRRSDFTTEATDEVCSEGHPMVIRLGRNGRFLACSLYPGAQGDQAAAGRGAGNAGRRGRGRGLPGVRTGHAGRAARTVRSFRRLLALSRLPVHPQDRPAAARTARLRGHLPQVQPGPPGHPPRAPDGQPLLGLLALSEVRLHLVTRAAWALLHDADDGPVAREGETGAICLKCGAPIELPEGDVVGKRLPGGEPNPDALAAPRRRSAGRRPFARQIFIELASSIPPRRRLTGGPAQVHTSRVTGADALDAFLRALAARGASPHTLRAYQTAVEQYLGWLGEHGHDWRAPGRHALRAYMAELAARP